MEKRFILAIALSFLVLFTWSVLLPKPQPVENKAVTSSNLQLNTTPPFSSISKVALTVKPSVSEVEETVKFTQDNREIIFSPSQADIVEVVFKDKLEHRFPLKQGFLSGGDILFKQQNLTEDSITFIYEDQIKRIVKKFTFPFNSYLIQLDTRVENLSPLPIQLNPKLIIGRLDLSTKNPQFRYQDVFVANKEKTMHFSAGKDVSASEIKFIGLRDQYFCIIVAPIEITPSAYIKKIAPYESEVGILLSDSILRPKTQIGHSYRIYIGPQDLHILNSINPEWTTIIYFGLFDVIAQVLLQLLGFFYGLVHNWGWAIIILSLTVYFLLFPLLIKQMRSMKKWQTLQPKIEALRQEFKNNPQRLNKEMIELYKEHKVNPFSGCLPLLLQMPIFFALYQALIRSTALRGAQFLWIKDLSSPDKLFVLKNALPFLGNQINILPILMAISMFVQQKISMVRATGEMAEQQKIMSIIMPVMFGVIFYQMPSGLVLYWFVNSILMLCYQLRINSQK